MLHCEGGGVVVASSAHDGGLPRLHSVLLLDDAGRDLLYKYFASLETLELRFPEVRVPFPW